MLDDDQLMGPSYSAATNCSKTCNVLTRYENYLYQNVVENFDER